MVYKNLTVENIRNLKRLIRKYWKNHSSNDEFGDKLECIYEALLNEQRGR